MSDMYIEQDSLLKGTLGVSGAVNLQNTLQVAQGATFMSDMYIEQDSLLKGTLGVSGAVNLQNTLEVAQGATFQSEVFINNSMGVTGNINIYGLNDIKVNGVGLQEQIAYLYNYLFSASYATISAEAASVQGSTGVEGGRSFDQNGDDNAIRSYTTQAVEIVPGL